MDLLTYNEITKTQSKVALRSSAVNNIIRCRICRKYSDTRYCMLSLNFLVQN